VSGTRRRTSYATKGGAGELARVVRLLDGTRTTAEVALQSGVAREAVEGVVDHLLAQGLLQASADSYIDHLVDLLGSARSGTASRRDVRVVGGALAMRIAALLAESEPALNVDTNPRVSARLDELARDDAWLADGLEQTRAMQPFAAWAQSLVILADDLVDPHRARAEPGGARPRVPHAARRAGRPLRARRPARRPRCECVLGVLRDAARHEHAPQRGLRRLQEGARPGQRRGASDPVPVVASLAASLAVTDALSFVTTDEAVTIDQAWSVFLPTMEITNHEVLRVPGCAGCGASPERDEADLYFDLRALSARGTC
jgi:hypothetical protein